MNTARNILMVEDVQVSQAIDAAAAAMLAAGHRVTRHPDAAALRRDATGLAQADILVVSSNCPVPREVLDAMKNLRGVVVPAIGTEMLDVPAITERGIVIANGATPENFESMAEATVLFMLASFYQLHRSEALLRNRQPRPGQLYARMLKGRTIGMIGLGRIARGVVARLQGWNVELIAYTPRAATTAAPSGVRFVSLDELLEKSDIVSIHASLNNETRGMLDAKRIRQMKPGAVLVNTSRGGIVDEVALCEAIRENRIAGIALDTFSREPLPTDSPLRDIPNAILTPHIVGHTLDAMLSLDITVVENLNRVLAGATPVHVRNPEVLPAWLAKFGASH